MPRRDNAPSKHARSPLVAENGDMHVS
jgi:hypothetical protein